MFTWRFVKQASMQLSQNKVHELTGTCRGAVESLNQFEEEEKEHGIYSIKLSYIQANFMLPHKSTNMEYKSESNVEVQ